MSRCKVRPDHIRGALPSRRKIPGQLPRLGSLIQQASLERQRQERERMQTPEFWQEVWR